MSPEARRIYDQIMRLPDEDRAELESMILGGPDANDAFTPEQIAAYRRRSAEIDSGKATRVPKDRAMRMIRWELDVPLGG